MKRISILALLAVAAHSSLAHAAAEIDEQLLAVGVGSSSPSVTDAIADNPAALAWNRRLKVVGSGDSEDRRFNPFSAGGQLVFGNGSIGGTLGAHTYKINGAERMAGDYGLGAYSDSIKAMIGIGGTTKFNKADRVGGDSHLINVGILSNPYGSTRVGVTLVGILGGIDTYVTGISTETGGGSWFSLDMASDTKTRGRCLEPALGFRSSGMAFQVGYGFQLDHRAPNYVRKGFEAGFNFYLSRDFSLQAVYNRHSKYYVALIASL